MDLRTEESVEQSLFDQFKKNKLLIILLIITLILGIYLRFNDYAIEGYDSDDMNTIPAAVFTYYPHNYFPGLVSTEPPLGNYIIGLGCIASGEDFAGVSKIKPLFFPDRSAYIGKAMKNAEKYCFIPNHVFGLIFLAGVVIFAFSFFSDAYPVMYFVMFFSFFPTLISLSRRISVDIFLFTFIIFALVFLWKSYKIQKDTFKEKLYLFLAFGFLGLASATKFTAGVFIISSFALMLEKYHEELFYLFKRSLKYIDIKILENKLNTENIKLGSLFKTIVISILSSSFFMMLFFNFSFKNLTDTYFYMTSLNAPGIQKLDFSLINFLNWLIQFLITINIFDIFVYLFSIFIFIKIIFKKNKTIQEKFIIYLTLFGFFILITFKVVTDMAHGLPFMFGFFILMGLVFSEKKYSLFNTFKIRKNYLLIFMVTYLISSFLTLYFAPFHNIVNNPIFCSLTHHDRCKSSIGGSAKSISLYLDSVLNKDETFLPTGIYNFYTRYNDDILWWIFYSNFKKQTGKEPRLEDYLKYYQPEGRRVRYIHTDPYPTEQANYIGIGIDQDILKKYYKPDHVIKLYGKESVYIYDLDNLIKK